MKYSEPFFLQENWSNITIANITISRLYEHVIIFFLEEWKFVLISTSLNFRNSLPTFTHALIQFLLTKVFFYILKMYKCLQLILILLHVMKTFTIWQWSFLFSQRNIYQTHVHCCSSSQTNLQLDHIVILSHYI